MFAHLDLGNGYNYYMTQKLLDKGVKAVVEHRKTGCCNMPPEGDDEDSVLRSQAVFMYSVIPQSRA